MPPLRNVTVHQSGKPVGVFAFDDVKEFMDDKVLDALGGLLRIVSQQNGMISQLRRNQEILGQKMDQLTRPGSTDFAVRLDQMAGDGNRVD